MTPARQRHRVGVEAAAALLAGALLAGVLKWPVLRHLRTAVPEDLGDPLLQTWQLAWGAHALLRRPLHPFEANAFYPLPSSLAFSDSLLGYAPLGVLFGTGPQAALVRYNVVFLLSYALAFAGTYLLCRQLGAGRGPAGVAALAFAYAPWHLAQEGHLQILSAGAIPLSLALLARGHGWPHGPARPRLALLGWAVAAWQLTLGFGLGLAFGYLVGVLVLLAAGALLLPSVRAARRPGRRLLQADAAGLVLFAAVGVVFALPYLQTAAAHPEARRSLAEVAYYSPPPAGLVTYPADSLLWGGRQVAQRAALAAPAETTLSPGLVLVLLAAVGAAAGSAPRRRRLALLAAAAGLLALSLGTRLAGGRFSYLLLYEHAPGWQGIRTPGRLVVLLTLVLALLAAAGAQRLVAGRRPRVAAAACALLAGLVLLDVAGRTPTPAVPAVPAALDRPAGPVLVLPSTAAFDSVAMYFSTAGLYPLVNGNSGFVPAQLAALREQVSGFPDPASVVLLEQAGVRRVVLLPAAARGTAWEGAQDRPVAGLGLQRRTVGEAVVYELAAAR